MNKIASFAETYKLYFAIYCKYFILFFSDICIMAAKKGSRFMKKNQPTNIDSCIQRIVRFADSKGWRKARLAKEADVQSSTIRHLGNDDWNPTASTLRKLEAIIPHDFV